MKRWGIILCLIGLHASAQVNCITSPDQLGPYFKHGAPLITNGLSYIVGMEERTEDQWVLKPNPATDEFTVSEVQGSEELVVMDALGCVF